MKIVLTATEMHRTESFVQEETVGGSGAHRQSERTSDVRLQHAHLRFESETPNHPPADPEIDLCEGLMGTIPRLRGDRTQGRGAQPPR